MGLVVPVVDCVVVACTRNTTGTSPPTQDPRSRAVNLMVPAKLRPRKLEVTSNLGLMLPVCPTIPNSTLFIDHRHSSVLGFNGAPAWKSVRSETCSIVSPCGSGSSSMFTVPGGLPGGRMNLVTSINRLMVTTMSASLPANTPKNKSDVRASVKVMTCSPAVVASNRRSKRKGPGEEDEAEKKILQQR